MSFTDLDEKKLIKLVSEHPAIYDPDDDDYHNQLVKETHWQFIGQTLKKPAEECKRKWKFIRDGYSRYKKRCKDSGTTIPPKNAKCNRHKLLGFLDNSNTTQPAEPVVDQAEDTIDNDDNTETEYDYGNNFTFINTDLIETTHDIKVETDFIPKTKRQKKYDYNETLEEDNSVRQREDDVDLFCRHIAEVLRNLPPLYKAKAKKEISAVVSDYEIKAAQSIPSTSDCDIQDT